MRRSLSGKRVLVTRPPGRAGGLVRALEARGAEVLAVAAIRLGPPADPRPLRESTRGLRDGTRRPDILLFTSAPAADAFFDALKLTPGAARKALAQVRVLAIGPATAEAARRRGAKAEVPPGAHRAETLAGSLRGVKGLRVLFPRAEKARDLLPEALRRRGADVRIVAAYRTSPDRRSAGRLRSALLGPRRVDAVTFTSASTVESVADLLGPAFARALRTVRAVSIGPVTTAALRRRGARPAAEARPSTEAGLERAVVKAFQGGSR